MKDSAITYKLVTDGNIEPCRELCNELMHHQKEAAVKDKERFDAMNFDTRMKSSYLTSMLNHVVIAYDGENPIGYVYSTIDIVPEEARAYKPSWAGSGDGFYPEWVKLPQKIGCLSNLYVKSEYRSSGVGKALMEYAMKWLESFDDVKLLFVYISNGNEKNVMDFYRSYGFEYSHDVFDGFITACFKELEK